MLGSELKNCLWSWNFFPIEIGLINIIFFGRVWTNSFVSHTPFKVHTSFKFFPRTLYIISYATWSISPQWTKIENSFWKLLGKTKICTICIVHFWESKLNDLSFKWPDVSWNFQKQFCYVDFFFKNSQIRSFFNWILF